MTSRVHLGDCLDVLRELPDASVDAVVTDPPYGLEFMGKEWDRFAPEVDTSGRWKREDRIDPADSLKPERLRGRGPSYGGRTYTAQCDDCGRRDAFQNDHGCEGNWTRIPVHEGAPPAMLAFQRWTTEWALEALRVLKPGGHALVFGGTRTYHRLASGLEDAGFEIRDTIAWMYGSGFPKSLDVSKAIDARNGSEREVVGRNPNARGDNRDEGSGWQRPWQADPDASAKLLTAPATDDARTWQGWGTALKPAYEPVVVARKPLQGTVAANVLAHGTGALNVDGCRIENMGGRGIAELDAGRWPANVTLDPEAARMLDEQTGELPTGAIKPYTWGGKEGDQRIYGGGKGYHQPGDTIDFHKAADSGGASRFYYVAKTSRAERNAGLEGFDAVALDVGDERPSGSFNERLGNPAPAAARNHHPTVKPIELMRWLVRLVTPPGGVVLDPFTGSGTTGCACALEGFAFIGIEREPDYHAIAESRIRFWQTHGEAALEVVRQAEKAETQRAELAAAGQTSILDLLDG